MTSAFAALIALVSCLFLLYSGYYVGRQARAKEDLTQLDRFDLFFAAALQGQLANPQHTASGDPQIITDAVSIARRCLEARTAWGNSCE